MQEEHDTAMLNVKECLPWYYEEPLYFQVAKHTYLQIS